MYSDAVQRALDSIEAKPGNRVRLTKAGKAYEGILLPRPDVGDEGCVVLKLSSGYNVGIEFKGAKLERLGEGAKLESFPLGKVAPNPGLPSVSFVSTGGTIASRLDYVTGGVRMAMTPEEIFFAIPELADRVNVSSVSQLSNIASEDMGFRGWQSMAEAAARELNSGAEGVVITHGTDTMHYSSAALSFMLLNLTKPVVFVGAQRSSDRGASDAFMNILCGASVAARGDFAEVGICMHAEPDDSFCLFLKGTKARKMHTSRRDAFRPINCKPIARVFPDGRIELSGGAHRKRAQGEVAAATRFEPKVALVKAYPGSLPEIIGFYSSKGFKGIVIEGTGLGHVPTQTPDGKDSWIPHVAEAVKSGMVVAVASQCIYGRTNPFVYRNLRLLSGAGAVHCEDMTPETAFVKLGWLLGNNPPEEAKKMMPLNLVGEINPRVRHDEFLV
ncbi:MAG: Glu-tRNA(Gln) amidotransferase subunit GatD [Candidatus ainarchaeum sp.]|nr:Glu-tRNA(Gln) amidotransferase subunit GatD [Candidatus ainarchaeum sp.]